MSGGLEGKAVLVTGGGTGIGRACAARLAADGAVVTICGRTQSRLEEAAASIGGDVRWVVADVTSDDDMATAVAAATVGDGHLHGVVANAGGGGAIQPLHVLDTAEFRRVMDLNLLGTFVTVKHAVPAMLAAGGGSFVGMSSIAGHQTHRWFGAYGPSKAAIEHLMRNAADEYGAAGIRFNSVQPGFVSTEIMEGIPRDSAVYDSYLRNTPLGGVSEPEDVADVVRFLLGDESRRVTGQAVVVDGGHHLRGNPDFTMFVPPDMVRGLV